jgi:hypothetical protein
MSKNIELIEKIAENLELLDKKNKDRTITLSEFNLMFEEKNKEIVFKILAGTEKIKDWNDFKLKFINNQNQYGFTWMSRPGQGGPITLDEIQLPAVVGTELAVQEMKKNVSNGSFDDLIRTKFKTLMKYINSDLSRIDFKEARESFKEYEENNNSYKFSPGRSSFKYELSQKKYIFSGKNTKRAEPEFGNLIVNRLKDVLGLDKLIHAQESRGAGKYRNLDFMGFKIQRHISGDEFLMYSFELKPSNSIESISQAISQAVNYHYLSNYTYIIIPFFDNQTFYDNDRFADLIDMCTMNNLGVLSVIMDLKKNTLSDITEVLPAPKTEIEDSERLLELVNDSQWEMCH